MWFGHTFNRFKASWILGLSSINAVGSPMDSATPCRHIMTNSFASEIPSTGCESFEYPDGKRLANRSLASGSIQDLRVEKSSDRSENCDYCPCLILTNQLNEVNWWFLCPLCWRWVIFLEHLPPILTSPSHKSLTTGLPHPSSRSPRVKKAGKSSVP